MKILIFILGFYCFAFSQTKADILIISDSTNHVYGILKSNAYSNVRGDTGEAEFISDFYWHLNEFSSSTGIEVHFFECDKIFFHGEEIKFHPERSAMIIIIKEGSKKYLKFDGVVSRFVLQQETAKLYE